MAFEMSKACGTKNIIGMINVWNYLFNKKAYQNRKKKLKITLSNFKEFNSRLSPYKGQSEPWIYFNNIINKLKI